MNNATQGIEQFAANYRNQASCGSEIYTSALAKCIKQSEANSDLILNVSQRITNLLDRLGGPTPKTASCGGAGSPDCSTGGVLCNHLSHLELQSQHIGSLQADLAALESLL